MEPKVETGIFPSVVRKLVQGEPEGTPVRLASVSIILKDRTNPSTLLIRRADRSGDPWSGQVAFPGGKMQESDRSVRATAARETAEELSLDLDTHARFLGYFGKFRTHTGEIDVIPSVFELTTESPLRPNGEVASYRWVELRRFLDSASRSVYRSEFGGETRELPAYKVDGLVVWGLTHRILSSLLSQGE